MPSWHPLLAIKPQAIRVGRGPGLAHVSTTVSRPGAWDAFICMATVSLLAMPHALAPGSQGMQKPPESTTHRRIPAEAVKENVPEWRSWVAWRKGEGTSNSKPKLSLALKSSQ